MNLALRQEVVLHIVAALVAGGAIGLERSFHGRAAGFRTHALVCLASALLMVFALYQQDWFPRAGDALRIEPTRMAQGIMTGIGFLGAGVIFKGGMSVRGLTTAASIWTTSAIGILMGSGLFLLGAVATVFTLGVLSVFRRIEVLMPVHSYALHRVRFARGQVIAEADLRALLERHDFSVSDLSYQVTDDAQDFEYEMTLQTHDSRNFGRLAVSLSALENVRAFQITPGGQ